MPDYFIILIHDLLPSDLFRLVPPPPGGSRRANINFDESGEIDFVYFAVDACEIGERDKVGEFRV